MFDPADITKQVLASKDQIIRDAVSKIKDQVVNQIEWNWKEQLGNEVSRCVKDELGPEISKMILESRPQILEELQKAMAQVAANIGTAMVEKAAKTLSSGHSVDEIVKQLMRGY